LAYIVIGIDILIAYSFLIALGILNSFEEIEEQEHTMSTLTPADFTVVVKNMPAKEEYQSFLELKAQLWKHFEQSLKDNK